MSSIENPFQEPHMNMLLSGLGDSKPKVQSTQRVCQAYGTAVHQPGAKRKVLLSFWDFLLTITKPSVVCIPCRFERCSGMLSLSTSLETSYRESSSRSTSAFLLPLTNRTAARANWLSAHNACQRT